MRTAEQASKKACEQIRVVFAETITKYPYGNPNKGNKKPLNYSNDDVLIEEFADEWSWYMQGWTDSKESVIKADRTAKQVLFNYPWDESTNDKYYEEDDVLNAMQEYANQFTKPSDNTVVSVKVWTDEEIKTASEKEWEDVHNSDCRRGGTGYNPYAFTMGFKCCAKWMRDKTQQDAVDPVALLEWIGSCKSAEHTNMLFNGEISPIDFLDLYREELNKKK